MIIKKYKIFLFIYLVVSIIGFFTLGMPSLNGEIDIQTYSDSLTYEKFAKLEMESSLIFSVASNVLGPVLILKLLNYNYILIFIFNIVLLVVSLFLIFKYNPNINKKIFLFFVLMTPLLYFSLFNVNKEIIALFVMALFLAFLRSKNLLLLFLTILIAYFVRWQLAFFFILILFFMLIDKFFKKRLIVIFLFTIIISIVYPSISYIFSDIIAHASVNNDLKQGMGIFPLLNQIQNSIGGYFVVVVPKILQINIGLVKRVDMLGNPEDFWNYFVLLLHSAMTLLLLIFLIYKKKFRLKNDLLYIAIIFAIFFALTPIISVRYFFPMYILLCVVASQKQIFQIGINNEKNSNIYRQLPPRL